MPCVKEFIFLADICMWKWNVIFLNPYFECVLFIFTPNYLDESLIPLFLYLYNTINLVYLFIIIHGYCKSNKPFSFIIEMSCFPQVISFNVTFMFTYLMWSTPLRFITEVWKAERSLMNYCLLWKCLTFSGCFTIDVYLL